MVTHADGHYSDQHSSESNDASLHNSQDTPPTSPPPSPPRNKPTNPPKATRVPKTAADVKMGRHINLQPHFTAYLTWSNDPSHLDLYGSFGASPPNLTSDFRLDSQLSPILKEKKGDMYICRDEGDVYYVWDPWHGPLVKVPAEYGTEAEVEDGDFGEDLGEVEKVVGSILFNMPYVLEEGEVVGKRYE